MHVSIRRCLHKYLAISCHNKFYFFKTPTFGLTTSPRIFTYIMKYPLSILHSAGVKSDRLLGRPLYLGGLPSPSTSFRGENSIRSVGSGFSPKSTKIWINPLKANHLPRDELECGECDLLSPSFLFNQHSRESRITHPASQDFLSTVRESPRQNSVRSTDITTRQVVYRTRYRTHIYYHLAPRTKR